MVRIHELLCVWRAHFHVFDDVMLHVALVSAILYFVHTSTFPQHLRPAAASGRHWPLSPWSRLLLLVAAGLYHADIPRGLTFQAPGGGTGELEEVPIDDTWTIQGNGTVGWS